SFSQLKSLKKLYLHSNSLTILPDSFSQLKNLQKLDLSYNQLTTLPDFFGDLKSLQELDLEDNQLTNLPDSFSQLESLQKLYLEYNPFNNDEDILEYFSIKSLFQYLRERKQKKIKEMKKKMEDDELGFFRIADGFIYDLRETPYHNRRRKEHKEKQEKSNEDVS
ncbi:MAG: hypothetical protein GF329_02830, partial [Candidatus Lokiarchaeota archaeon]|nr:hypothetical protein [Candidatus Lokiarchaeota archaeon]